MALIKCTNCGHMVSDKGTKCPKCGTPIQKIEEAAKPIEKEEKAVVEVESPKVETPKADKPMNESLKDVNPISDSSSLETNVHNEVFLEPQSSKKGKIVLLCSIVVIAAILGVYFLWNGKVMAAYEKQDKPIYSEELVKYAESGDAVAQCDLGVCYANGSGIAKDSYEAFKWLKLSAEKGYEDAMCYLGSCFYKGDGVSQDYGEAVKWWKKAAEKGNEDAKEALRNMDY
ncbi:MAG: tetratricopeptide repeat protein [Bacteroidales bacterium]|nr:tetratricopeptide repeat protein [Bacteroidales bacterium]